MNAAVSRRPGSAAGTRSQVFFWALLVLLISAVVALRTQVLVVPCVQPPVGAISDRWLAAYVLPPDDGFPSYPPLCMVTFQLK